MANYHFHIQREEAPPPSVSPYNPIYSEPGLLRQPYSEPGRVQQPFPEPDRAQQPFSEPGRSQQPFSEPGRGPYINTSVALQVSAPRYLQAVRPSQAPHLLRPACSPTESLRSTVHRGRNVSRSRSRTRSRRRARETRRRRRSSSSSSSPPPSPCTTRVSSVTQSYPENPKYRAVPTQWIGWHPQMTPTTGPAVVPAVNSPFHPRPQIVPPQLSPFHTATIAHTPTPPAPGHSTTPPPPPPPFPTHSKCST